jgi:hypothetical protein
LGTGETAPDIPPEHNSRIESLKDDQNGNAKSITLLLQLANPSDVLIFFWILIPN